MPSTPATYRPTSNSPTSNSPTSNSPTSNSPTSNRAHRSARVVPRAARRGRLLAVASVLALLGLLFGNLPATAQDSIDDARDMRDATREEQLEAETELDLLDAEFADMQAALDAADELVSIQETKVEAARVELELARTRQAQTETAVAWAEFDIDSLATSMTDLAVERYIGGGERQTVDLFGDADINAGVARNAVLEVVTNQSEDVIDVAREAQTRFATLTEQAEESIARIEAIEADLEGDLDKLEEARGNRARIRDLLEQKRQGWRNIIGELEAEENDLTAFIAAEQARIEGRTPQISAQSSQGWVWPTAGGVGSVFGNRLHPVLGYYRMHSGLDIGGAQGQPIWSAVEGTVIVAGVQGGYGNTIVVDHGGGLSTLYAHQSQFAVGVGDRVETGQLIGYVGSTGMSTGPHLHFEVRQNGTPIDPMPFMP